MSGKSDYLENKMLDHNLGTAPFTSPSTVYLALFSTDPGDDNSGTELSGSGYARQAATFAAASGGSATNTSTHTFTSSSGDWTAATHFAVLDALTGGNQLYNGALSAGIIIGTGGHDFSAGDFTVTES